MRFNSHFKDVETEAHRMERMCSEWEQGQSQTQDAGLPDLGLSSTPCPQMPWPGDERLAMKIINAARSFASLGTDHVPLHLSIA